MRACASLLGFLGAVNLFHGEMMGTMLCVTAASPHTKCGCSGEAVCFLAADGELAAWVLRLCLVCDGITLSRAGGGIFLQRNLVTTAKCLRATEEVWKNRKRATG